MEDTFEPGTISRPPGTLMIIDGGYLGLCSGHRSPTNIDPAQPATAAGLAVVFPADRTLTALTARLQTFLHLHPQGADIGDYVRFVLVLAPTTTTRSSRRPRISPTPTGREQRAECRHEHEPSTSLAGC